VTIDARAAAGFARAAEAYERGRPGYPAAALDLLRRALDLRPGRTVLDLAAGTGKMTRLLAQTGAEVIPVEPVAEMRAHVPQALAGTAEEIPLADASVDAAVVAQAFHWFDGARALAELHRVLRPGGRLALVWNAWDDAATPWLGRVRERVDRHSGDTPRHGSRRWRDAFDETRLFEPLRHEAVPNAVETTRGVFLDRIASISFVAALPDAERDELLADVEALLPTGERLAVAHRTDVYLTTRR
jgi:SAM-dependent methyltransferase